MKQRWILGVLVALHLAFGCGAFAEEPLSGADWRVLWPLKTRDQWQARSDAELRRLADMGNAPAQFILWRKWRRSHPEPASNYLASAARSGLPQAVFEIGDTAFIDPSASLEVRTNGWDMMRRAAASGYPIAAESVARYEAGFLSGIESDRLPYQRGHFPPRDYPHSIELFRLAVAGGRSEAMVSLALLYSSGIGEPRNEEESPQKLLLAAAHAGNEDAYRHLANRSLHGHGVERDLLEAARWAYFDFRSRSSGRDLGLVDAEGRAKAQTKPERQDLAELLTQFIAVADRHDPKEALALAERHARAEKWEPAAVLYHLAAKWGKASPAQQWAAEEHLTKAQLRKAADTAEFPAIP